MITTELLTLRQLRREDAGWIAEGIAHPESVRWLPAVPWPYGLEQAQAYLERTIGTDDHLAIETDAPQGVVSLRTLEDGRKSSGFWLRPEAHGQGLMTEAVAARLSHHFEQSEVEVSSGWVTGNTASERVHVKLGYEPNGSGEVNSLFHKGPVSHVLVVMRAARWRALQDFAIETPRLTLRPMTLQDAPDLLRIVTRAEVGRMLFRFRPDWTLPAAQAFIAQTRYVAAQPFRLGIYRDDQLIGSVGVSAGAEPDVYYFLDPQAQGQGFAREAMTAFCADLFARLKVPALKADVFHDNPASDHILRRIGFAPCGIGLGTSAARVEPAPITLYRLTRHAFEAAT